VLAPGRRLAPPAAALLLLSIPVHHFYAQYGQVDHQVVEPLLPSLAMLLALRAALGASPRPRLCACSAGLSATLALWFWPGAFIPIAVVHAVLLALALVRGREVVVRAFQLSLAALVSTPLLIPAMPRPLRFDIWTVSLLQPSIYLLFGAFWTAALALAAARPRTRTLVLAAALVVCGLLAIVARNALRSGLEFVLREDPVVAMV